jgi:hypothetical protein
MYLQNEDQTIENILEFGLEDEELGVSFVKILSFLRKMVSKKLI